MRTFKEIALTETKDSIGIFSGRFQPVTKAHSDIINTMAKENRKVIIFLVKGKKTSENKTKNPFDSETQKKMLELVSPDNVEIKIISTGFFVDELNELPDETKFVAYAGSDRIKAYKAYEKYMGGNRTLEVKEVKRTDKGISATKVRQSLKDNNFEEFKALTDKKIHKMFNELRAILG